MKPSPQKYSIIKTGNILKNIGVLFLALNPYTLSAYEMLQPLPNVTASDANNFGSYLSKIYILGIGLAGVLAVLVIVIGGIQYIGSGMSPSGKTDAKDKITNAILGLLLALISWLILNTIDPNLVSLRF